jgi:hypothetical protein
MRMAIEKARSLRVLCLVELWLWKKADVSCSYRSSCCELWGEAVDVKKSRLAKQLWLFENL